MLSIVIPTYNRYSLLKTRISELLKLSTSFNIEILVIDNNSNDQTKDLINCSDIKYIREERQGRAFALRTGIKYSTQEYILILDDDDPILNVNILKSIEFVSQNRDVKAFFLPAEYNDFEFSNKFIHGQNYNWLDVMVIENIRDLKQIVKTKLMKSIQPKLFDNEKRMPTSWYWLKISELGINFQFINFNIIQKKYEDGGMTKNIRKSINKSPKNQISYLKLRFNIFYKNFKIEYLSMIIKTLIEIIRLGCLINIFKKNEKRFDNSTQ